MTLFFLGLLSGFFLFLIAAFGPEDSPVVVIRKSDFTIDYKGKTYKLTEIHYHD